jgi:broad specificity phosphatase PhoE
MMDMDCAGDILIVSHAGPNKAIIGQAIEVSSDCVINIAPQDNCCINFLRWDGKIHLEKVNYVHRG